MTVKRFRLGRWSAAFEPREIDVGGTDFVVAVEMWERNDYRIDLQTGLDGVVLDVGANIGTFAVLAAKAGAQRVIALEPESANRDRLELHVCLNDVVDRVDVRMLAVTGDGRDVAIEGDGGGAHVAAFARLPGSAVPSTTLAELIEEVGPVSMLKMDIEGGEWEAFSTVTSEHLAMVDRIAMEWHGPAIPRLAYLADGYSDIGHWAREIWGGLVTRLAEQGTIATLGPPTFTGVLHWNRNGASH